MKAVHVHRVSTFHNSGAFNRVKKILSAKNQIVRT